MGKEKMRKKIFKEEKYKKKIEQGKNERKKSD